MEQDHDLLTVKETAEYLRIPRPTVYYLVQRGKLPAIQIGGRWRVKKGSLDHKYFRDEAVNPSKMPKVLVVDDDPGIRSLFRSYFGRAGYHHSESPTGKSAMQTLKGDRFDLVLLDLQLPDVGGDVVYAFIKNHDPDLPVVVITGYPDSEMLNRILESSPVMVLKKPLEISQLEKAVKIAGR